MHNSGRAAERSLNHPRQPVVDVSFSDAKALAMWLTEEDRRSGLLPDNYIYRLPTGDEWTTLAECRDGRKFPWGNYWPPISGQAGNYHGTEAVLLDEQPIPEYNDAHPVTAKVDDLWSNPLGLHGVGGNVWEYTLKADRNTFDALRGGFWGSTHPLSLACTRRFKTDTSKGSVSKGFRLVLAEE